MNEQNLHNDYLNMMSAPNYNNIVAPQETQQEYINRWVWGHKIENVDHKAPALTINYLVISNFFECEIDLLLMKMWIVVF
jgi:hypothetical protein